MKTSQFAILTAIGVIACLLLAVISLQLHSAKPITQGDLLRVWSSHDRKAIAEMKKRMPVVSASVDSVGSVDYVRKVEEIVQGVDVDVKNTVEVGTSSYKEDGKTFYVPLDVRINRD